MYLLLTSYVSQLNQGLGLGWPCNVELAQPSSKVYDLDYSDDDDDDNEMDELSVDQMIFLLF